MDVKMLVVSCARAALLGIALAGLTAMPAVAQQTRFQRCKKNSTRARLRYMPLTQPIPTMRSAG